MRRKEPWFKLWANDYLTDSDVDELSLEAQGLLLRMWCVCSQRGNIPDDPEEIARLTRCRPQNVLQCHLQCKPFFELRDGLLYSARMELEKAKSDLARTNAEKRYRKQNSSTDDAIGSANGSAKRLAQKATKSESQNGESQRPMSHESDVGAASPPTIPPAEPIIDANMMARSLCERLSLSAQMGPGSVYMSVYDRAKIEAIRGGNLETLCNRMAEAYEKWIREELKFRWGAAKFFGEGWWERPGAWPREGQDSLLDKSARREKKWEEFEAKENDNATE